MENSNSSAICVNVSASQVITNSSEVVSTVTGIGLLRHNYGYLNSLAENRQFLGMKNGALRNTLPLNPTGPCP